eukprot:gene17797-32721_t
MSSKTAKTSSSFATPKGQTRLAAARGNVVRVRDRNDKGFKPVAGSEQNGVQAGKKFSVQVSMKDKYGNEITTLEKDWIGNGKTSSLSVTDAKGKSGQLTGETEKKQDKATWSFGCLTFDAAFSSIKLQVKVDGIEDLVITRVDEKGNESDANCEWGSPLRAGEKFCVDVEIRDRFDNVFYS